MQLRACELCELCLGWVVVCGGKGLHPRMGLAMNQAVLAIAHITPETKPLASEGVK